jgi:superkiller protein 3
MPEAIEHWEQALRINPDYADVHSKLGVALAEQGQMPEAMQHWERVLRVNPAFPGAHCNLGIALCTEGKWQEAAGHFERELLAHSDNALTHYYLGVALGTNEQDEERHRTIQAGLGIQPRYGRGAERVVAVAGRAMILESACEEGSAFRGSAQR